MKLGTYLHASLTLHIAISGDAIHWEAGNLVSSRVAVRWQHHLSTYCSTDNLDQHQLLVIRELTHAISSCLAGQCSASSIATEFFFIILYHLVHLSSQLRVCHIRTMYVCFAPGIDSRGCIHTLRIETVIQVCRTPDTCYDCIGIFVITLHDCYYLQRTDVILSTTMHSCRKRQYPGERDITRNNEL